MDVEVSASRTGSGLETDGFTHRLGGEREGFREGHIYKSYKCSVLPAFLI